jgi:hypothetical protein
MATQATPIQILRSSVNNKRPDAAKLLPGQPAVNTDPQQPGLFFADSTGANLFKIGPTYIGDNAPNDGATAPGQLGNANGEMWLDTNPANPGPILKIWDASQNRWVGAMPFVYGAAIMQNFAPPLSVPFGTMWWNTDTGLLYILYNDGTSSQWVQIAASVVS